jgi:hypothetical protein
MAAAAPLTDSTALTLWRMTLDGKEGRCVILTAPTGFEAQMRVDGTLLYSRTLSSLDEVARWADIHRTSMETRGWKTSATALAH